MTGIPQALGITDRGESSKDAQKTIEDITNYLTIKPKTGGGKIAAGAYRKTVGALLEKYMEGTQALGEQQIRINPDDSPGTQAAKATFVKTIGDVIPMVLGAKAIKGKPLTIQGKQPLQPLESAIKAPVTGVGKAVKATGTAVKNIFPVHKERVGRLLNTLASSDRAAIIAAMEKAKPGETAGQAGVGVGRAEFSALDKLMQKRDPTQYGELGRIREAQQANRISELKKEGKTPEAVADAILERKTAADPLYEAGRAGEAVGVKDIVSNINKLIKDNPGNLELLTELRKVKKGLTKGRKVRTSGQEVLSTVDGLKAAIANKDNAFIKEQLTKIKNEIIESVPKYKEGETVFREKSKPVNQMQYFQQLVKELMPKLGSKDRAVQFVNSLENARLTIKKASDGSVRFESMDEFLTPEQIALTKKLRAELDRDVSLGQQGSAGYGKLTKTVGEELAPVEFPGMLSSKVMVFRNIMARLKGHATEGTLKQLEKVWNKPAEVAKLMKKFSPEGQKILESEMSKLNKAAIVGAIGGQANEQP